MGVGPSVDNDPHPSSGYCRGEVLDKEPDFVLPSLWGQAARAYTGHAHAG